MGSSICPKNTPSEPGRAGRPKSQEKRNQILTAASDLFLEHGFTNTSMDLVAAQSGVSKQTVYSHFKNKDKLYTAVIDWKCNEYQLDFGHTQDLGPLPDALKQVATQVVALMHDEKVIAMYRVVIGEARANPHVAELFYDAGPQQSVHALTHYLAKQQTVPLTNEQAREAAIDFFNLLKSEFHMRSILEMPFALNQKQRDHLINSTVRKTLALIHLASEQQ
ncbi:TetR/AcrR family transcriptional regulator [Aestuariibacter salexigens]|uniref:TetR/AcrR family transcriptional regulator n=1 Tax=Aestuariibacter salexigens TaxID=226010 RepID=UPI0005593396|nr:TetR/AcrR family transcriptional regulator [Aestuariibacter salexigens]